MPLLPYEYLHLVNCPEVVTISDNYCICNNMSLSLRFSQNVNNVPLEGTVSDRELLQMVTMKLRRPYTTASMWSSGKITCTGANSEPQAKVAARRSVDGRVGVMTPVTSWQTGLFCER